ncbi:MAG: hypothetical protein AB7G21_09105 [Dehalococcoidia bacterium]
MDTLTLVGTACSTILGVAGVGTLLWKVTLRPRLEELRTAAIAAQRASDQSARELSGLREDLREWIRDHELEHIRRDRGWRVTSGPVIREPERA